MARNLDQWDRDFYNRPGRTSISAGVLAIVIIIILSIIGGAGFWALNLAAQPGRVITKTFDADNMIYNYEWFRQQDQDINAMDPKIANAQAPLDAFVASAGPRSQWTTAMNSQFSQMQSQVTGLQNQKLSMIATYNARASMMNRSLFMVGTPPVK